MRSIKAVLAVSLLVLVSLPFSLGVTQKQTLDSKPEAPAGLEKVYTLPVPEGIRNGGIELVFKAVGMAPEELKVEPSPAEQGPDNGDWVMSFAITQLRGIKEVVIRIPLIDSTTPYLDKIRWRQGSTVHNVEPTIVIRVPQERVQKDEDQLEIVEVVDSISCELLDYTGAVYVEVGQSLKLNQELCHTSLAQLSLIEMNMAGIDSQIGQYNNRSWLVRILNPEDTSYIEGLNRQRALLEQMRNQLIKKSSVEGLVSRIEYRNDGKQVTIWVKRLEARTKVR